LSTRAQHDAHMPNLDISPSIRAVPAESDYETNYDYIISSVREGTSMSNHSTITSARGGTVLSAHGTTTSNATSYNTSIGSSHGRAPSSDKSTITLVRNGTSASAHSSIRHVRALDSISSVRPVRPIEAPLRQPRPMPPPLRVRITEPTRRIDELARVAILSAVSPASPAVLRDVAPPVPPLAGGGGKTRTEVEGGEGSGEGGRLRRALTRRGTMLSGAIEGWWEAGLLGGEFWERKHRAASVFLGHGKKGNIEKGWGGETERP
jgi:hypothetical protein